MGIDQVGKPSVHKDPDRGGDKYSNHMCIRDDVRARRYPGMVPVVEAVTMGVQAVVLLAPGCLGPGWSRSAPVVGAVTMGVQDMEGDRYARRVLACRDQDMGGDRYASLVLACRYPGMVPVVGAVTMSALAVAPGLHPAVAPGLHPAVAPGLHPAVAPGLHPAMRPVPAPAMLPV